MINFEYLRLLRVNLCSTNYRWKRQNFVESCQFLWTTKGLMTKN